MKKLLLLLVIAASAAPVHALFFARKLMRFHPLHAIVSGEPHHSAQIVQAVQGLYKSGLRCLINCGDEQGRTPLMCAVVANQEVEVFKALAHAEPDLTKKDRDGRTVHDHIQDRKEYVNYHDDHLFEIHAALIAQQKEAIAELNAKILRAFYKGELAKWHEVEQVLAAHKKT